MRSTYRRVAVVALLAGLSSGCGSGGGYNANNVSVTVSPAAVTIPANGQVTLTATVKGLCSTCASFINNWSITEDTFGPLCNWSDTPPTVSCPGGTIQETPGGPIGTLTVTYFAPSAPGTFNVVAEWGTLTSSPGSVPTAINKIGTSVVTVSP